MASATSLTSARPLAMRCGKLFWNMMMSGPDLATMAAVDRVVMSFSPIRSIWTSTPICLPNSSAWAMKQRVPGGDEVDPGEQVQLGALGIGRGLPRRHDARDAPQTRRPRDRRRPLQERPPGHGAPALLGAVALIRAHDVLLLIAGVKRLLMRTRPRPILVSRLSFTSPGDAPTQQRNLGYGAASLENRIPHPTAAISSGQTPFPSRAGRPRSDPWGRPRRPPT